MLSIAVSFHLGLGDLLRAAASRLEFFVCTIEFQAVSLVLKSLHFDGSRSRTSSALLTRPAHGIATGTAKREAADPGPVGGEAA